VPIAAHARLGRCENPRVPRLDAIGMIVSDIDKAIDFYRRLGLEFPEDPDPEGHGHVEATLPGGLRFMLDTEESVQSFDPGWSPPSGDARMAVAFLCESPEGVDRVYRELVDGGAEGRKEPWNAFWGQRYAEVGDPDGNVIDLFAPLEG
jgi:catechol 2,3-dioxygenase-like lactoylglutathione lyase family enzyme